MWCFALCTVELENDWAFQFSLLVFYQIMMLNCPIPLIQTGVFWAFLNIPNLFLTLNQLFWNVWHQIQNEWPLQKTIIFIPYIKYLVFSVYSICIIVLFQLHWNWGFYIVFLNKVPVRKSPRKPVIIYVFYIFFYCSNKAKLEWRSTLAQWTSVWRKAVPQWMMASIMLSASPGMVGMLHCKWTTGQSMNTSQQVHIKLINNI